MDLEKPRFRHDLVARPLEDAGVFYVDVSDPDSGRQFRFYDVEYSIACAMDGDRNIASLVEWTKAELGVETTPAELKSVVTTLAGLGYLDGEGARTSSAVEVVDLTTDVQPTAPPKAAAPAPAHTPQPGPAPRFAPDAPAPGVSFGDDEMARSANAETAGSAALDSAMDSMPIDDDNDFATDEPTRNAAAPAPDEREDSVTIQRPIKPAALGGGLADIVGAPPERADDDGLEMDLSAHVAVNKSKLAEAVKLSRAISVPTAAEVEAAAKAPADEAPAGRESVATKLPDAPPAAAAAPAVAAAAAVEAKRSPVVLIVAFLLLAAAGGAAYYFLVYKQGQPVAPAAPKTSEMAPSTETPKTPALPKGRVASTEAPPATITAPTAAAIEWVVTDGQAVAAEEVVAKLAGAKRAELPLAQAKDRLTFYQSELSRAAAANNTALIAQMQKKVDEKQQLVNDAQAKLEPLLVRASVAGPAQVVAPAGSKVAPGDALVRIAPKDFVFSVAIEDAPVGLVVGAPVKLAPEADRDRQVAGVVDKVAGAKAIVKLVPPVSVKAGDELVLLAP